MSYEGEITAVATTARTTGNESAWVMNTGVTLSLSPLTGQFTPSFTATLNNPSASRSLTVLLVGSQANNSPVGAFHNWAANGRQVTVVPLWTISGYDGGAGVGNEFYPGQNVGLNVGAMSWSSGKGQSTVANSADYHGARYTQVLSCAAASSVNVGCRQMWGYEGPGTVAPSTWVEYSGGTFFSLIGLG